MNVIGFQGTPMDRQRAWSTMIESKKSHRQFRMADDEQSQNIANLDKQVFDFWLSKYVAA